MRFNKNKKRAIILAVSSLLALQQTVVAPTFASSIIDAGGGIIKPNDQTGNFELMPDAVNGNIGFKHFQEFILNHGDIANFIFQWYQSQTGENPDLVIKGGDISKFVNFIDGQANINGIINALNAVNGGLKTDGQLVFVAPNGLVVGSSGVLNVGSLSVLTPNQASYDKLKEGMPTNISYTPQGFTKAVETSKTWDPNAVVIGNGTISIDGGILARGDVELNGGKVDIGANGKVLAGIGNNTDRFTRDVNEKDPAKNTYDAIKSRADALFDSLVKTDNMNTGNAFSNSNGNIIITSNVGTNVQNGGMVRTYSDGDTIITNTGVDGVKIAGEVANSHGKLTIKNSNGKIITNSTAKVKNNGTMDILNFETGAGIDLDGEITNSGVMNITNETGADGLIVRGTVTNNGGAATITNKNNKLNVESQGKIVSNGTSLLMQNTGANGINIMGHVDQNNKGTLTINSENSNVVIGDNTANDFYVTSDGLTSINVNNGNLYNYGVAKTLISTTDGANLKINVTDGAIGKEVGPCDDGICTGIGPDQRDLTKSINTSIDGSITAISTGKGSLANMASLNKDMHINQISADGRVILLADDSTNKGATPYDILNYGENAAVPNIKGKGISVIASGNIGKADNKVTFIQTAGQFNNESWNNDKFNYNPNAQYGVDMLAIKDINVKGLDNADGTKNDTNVCAMISRDGSINAEFSGNTYIREITAKKNIDLVGRGKNMYIEHLGQVPTYPQDYYGPNANTVPEKVTVKVLDLGTSWPDNPADSTIIIKQGQIAGKGELRPKEQDLTLTADNAYAGGYHFHMGKDRLPGKTYVEVDNNTKTLVNTNGDTPISIRSKAVRPNDVTAIGRDEGERNYYYGGSSQGEDPKYDKDGNPVWDEDKGTEKDDDNLVVPTTPTEPTEPTEPTTPTNPTEPTIPTEPTEPTIPTEPTEPTIPTEPTEPTIPTEPTEPTTPTAPTEPNIRDDADKLTWVQRKDISDGVPSIDKRQYMRFSVDQEADMISFESESGADSILNISRGGVQLAHSKKLKVGDVIPVKVKYGDLEINANVKIVSANDVKAGGEFIDLDPATANKLLYLNLMLDETTKYTEANLKPIRNVINIQ